MKVLVQWASLDPEDWKEIDSRDWATLPKAPVPSGQTLLNIDKNILYVNAINIQGVIFTGYDHYAINHLSDSCINLIAWDDDPEDHQNDFKAVEWTFHAVTNNTKQSWMGFYESTTRREKIESLGILNLLYTGHWSEFVKPSESVTMHGIWLSEMLYIMHKEKQSSVGWRAWA